MLAVVRVLRTREREVFRDGERHRRRRQQRKCHRAEVLLEVTEQRIPKALAVEHPARNESSCNVAVCVRPKQDANLGHLTDAIHAHGHRLDIQQRQSAARVRELLVGEPTGVRVRRAY